MPLLISAEGASRSAGELALGVLACPLAWSVMCFAVGLLLMLPKLGRFRKTALIAGALLCAVSFGLLAAYLPLFGRWANWPDWLLTQSLFWLMAGLALAAAVGTITMRSPLYSAIWFALTLLGVAGLLLVHGALFLGVATLVVYAGAILVMFLFVLMLAQPEGHADYDRISWGRPAVALAVLSAAVIVGGLAYRTADPQAGVIPAPVVYQADPAAPRLDKQLGKGAEAGGNPVQTDEHVATLGAVLFSVHMVSVEVAGVLLLVALVGAIAIVIQGRDARERRAAAEGGSA